MTGEDWRDQALCAQIVGAEPRWFDPFEAGEVSAYTEDPLKHPRIAVAVSVCVRCPVRSACLTAGVSGQEQGVWGGRYLSKKTAEKRKGAA